MLAFQHATKFDLEISLASNAAIDCELTGMTREGPFKFTFITDGLSLIQTLKFAIPDVPIWVTLRTKDADVRVNDVYAMVYLLINGGKNYMLCSGNLGQFYGVNWPVQTPLAPLQQHGQFSLATSANPAANAEWTLTVPAGQHWRIISIMATLVTDTNAANRAVELNVNTFAGGTVRIPLEGIITASQTVRAVWFDGAVSFSNATNLRHVSPWPRDFILPTASTIASVTANRQAGDDWGAAAAIIEIFYSDTP